MQTINVEQVLLFHKKIISQTGGSAGIRDLSVIESALSKAFQTFDGKDLYEGNLKKIVAIAYALIRNHGFVDGNKRIGVSVMLLLLKMNGFRIEYSQEELVKLGLKTAEGTYTEENIEQWILKHRV